MSNLNYGGYALPKTETKVKSAVQIYSLDNYHETPAETAGVFFNPPVGDTRVRFLSQTFVKGHQTWGTDNKPLRFTHLPEDLDPLLEKPKEFKAFKIWNYQHNVIMMWVITQKTVLDAIDGYTKPGSIPIIALDLIISKIGSGKNGTKYKVTPGNPAPITEQMQRLNQQTRVNWEGFFDGSKILTIAENAIQPAVVMAEREQSEF